MALPGGGDLVDFSDLFSTVLGTLGVLNREFLSLPSLALAIYL